MKNIFNEIQVYFIKIMFFTLDDMKDIFNSIYDTLKYDITTNNNDMIMVFSNHNLMKFFSSRVIYGDMKNDIFDFFE
jgi:hypothetical protein